MPIEAEWLTRKSRIDARLKQRGWHLVRFSPDLNLKTLDRIAVEELPTANGPADYGLFVSGRLLELLQAFNYCVAVPLLAQLIVIDLLALFTKLIFNCLEKSVSRSQAFERKFPLCWFWSDGGWHCIVIIKHLVRCAHRILRPRGARRLGPSRASQETNDVSRQARSATARIHLRASPGLGNRGGFQFRARSRCQSRQHPQIARLAGPALR